MCLNYEWYRRPTVDNLLSTVFANCEGELYLEELNSAEEYYAP
jgi:hypothetical protein